MKNEQHEKNGQHITYIMLLYILFTTLNVSSYKTDQTTQFICLIYSLESIKECPELSLISHNLEFTGGRG